MFVKMSFNNKQKKMSLNTDILREKNTIYLVASV